MKNLLWLVHGGLGERGKLGAPTFWKTVEGLIADGWNIRSDQPERIPEAIGRLLDDPAEAARLGDAAGEFARRNFWTWDERVAAEAALLNELLQTTAEHGE